MMLGGAEAHRAAPRRHQGAARRAVDLHGRHGQGLPVRSQERAPDHLMAEAPDVLIVGSGIGGATLAAGLAGSGARVTILERGEQLADEPAARDARAIFVGQHYRPKETVAGRAGGRIQPRQLLLCRRQLEVLRRGHAPLPRARFRRRSSTRAASRPAGRSPMPSWSLGTGGPSGCSRSAAPLGEDPTEPRRSSPIRRPGAGRARHRPVRERLAAQGLHPFSLPLAIDIERWLQRAATPWDAFPDTRSGKLDAETAALAAGAAQSRCDAGDRRQGRAPAAGAPTVSVSRAWSTFRWRATDAAGRDRRLVRGRRELGARPAARAPASPTGPAPSAATS